MKKKVLVFGVFDIFHDGHRHFLTESRKLGDFLVVSLATDHVVKKIKKKEPKNAFSVRREALFKSHIVDEVVEGDDTVGTWNILSRFIPDVIAVGYDQNELFLSLSRHLEETRSSIRVSRISPSNNVNLHSSILLKSDE